MEPKNEQQASDPVIAVFDIGKTNKKLFLFDAEYRVVFEKQVSISEIVDEDGDPCEDLAALREFVVGSLAALAKSPDFDLKAVNFSAYGSSLVYLGEDGKPLAPVYSYLKPYPEDLRQRFFETHGEEAILSQKSACPLEGSLNAGLQLYRFKTERPALFERIKHALFLPQWLSFLFSGRACTEITSLGCHTGIWDFEKGGWQQWLREERILGKLPPIISGGKMLPVLFEGRKFFVGPGLHDSSAALSAYASLDQEPFVLISTGTWCVSMNPFAAGPLTAADLEKGCLCYLSPAGHPVKASRRMLGRQYEAGAPIDQIVRQQLESTSLVLDASTRRIFVDGGFSQNEEYLRGLREGFSGLSGFSGIEVRASKLPQASALGAAMMMKKALIYET